MYASLTPRKEAEVLVYGQSLTPRKDVHQCSRDLADFIVCSRRTWLYASLTPRKDAEVVVHGPSLTSPSFAAAFHAALRTLIDDLRCPTWNASVQPLWDQRARNSAAAQPFADCRVVARYGMAQPTGRL